jgi:hypothetical protein
MTARVCQRPECIKHIPPHRHGNTKFCCFLCRDITERARKSIQAAALYKANPDKKRRQSAAWYAANKEKSISRSIAYHIAHPEVNRASVIRRNNKQRAAIQILREMGIEL